MLNWISLNNICLTRIYVYEKLVTLIERNNCVYVKKHVIFKSPDLTKLQEVVIDHRTKIYIALGADPKEARSRYLDRLKAKVNVHLAYHKPAAT
jgi:hypothetical protein